MILWYIYWDPIYERTSGPDGRSAMDIRTAVRIDSPLVN